MGSRNIIPIPAVGDWPGTIRALRKINIVLGIDSSPTFDGATVTTDLIVGNDLSIGGNLDLTGTLTLSGLTASRLIATDASKALVSSSISSWIAGTTNQITVTNDGDGTATLSAPQDIHTGASPTFADLTLSAPSNIYALSHDSFADFVSNEHINHTSVTLTAGTGLTGGGDISANRTFAVDGVLEDLDTLGTSSSDGEFIVATGAGVFAYESGDTARTSLGLGTTNSPTFTDLTLSSPSNIYLLSHDSFAGFVADEHIAHSGVSIIAGTGLSGGGTIDGNVTLNCTVTQYTDEDAQDAIGGILDDGTVGNIVFTYDDVGNVISAVTQDGEIDHDSLTNTHNLTTDIDHDQLTNFVSGEHFLQTAITNVSTALSTGLLKVTTGTGLLSTITDSSTNWDSAYTHVSNNGTDHSYIDQDVSTTATPIFSGLTIGVGTAATDYTLTFDGETNDGILTWMEDEDYFKFSDDILMNSTEHLYFNDTSSYIYDDATNLILSTNGEIKLDTNTGLVNGSELRFYDVGNSNYVGFEAPSLTADKIWVLPSADGSADQVLKTDGSGNLSWTTVSGASSSGCKVHRNGSDQTTGGAGSYGKVQFTTEDYDLNGEFDNATNYRFTPTTAGYYLVNLNVTYSDLSSGEYVEAYIYKNGSGVSINTKVTTSAWVTVNTSDILYLNGSTDYIEGYTRTQSASKTISGLAFTTFMSIMKL